jgi:hypothetical protein
MEEITPSESNSLSDIQETPRLLWNPKFHYHVCKTTTGRHLELAQFSSQPHILCFNNRFSISFHVH